MKLIAKLAASEAMMKSQHSAMSAPSPAADPLTAAAADPLTVPVAAAAVGETAFVAVPAGPACGC